MKRYKVAYVSGPLEGKRAEDYEINITKAWIVSRQLWEMGYIALTPHLLTADMDDVLERDEWLARDKELLSRCDLIVLIPGWRKSDGAKKERVWAEEMGLPIFEWPKVPPPDQLNQNVQLQ